MNRFKYFLLLLFLFFSVFFWFKNTRQKNTIKKQLGKQEIKFENSSFVKAKNGVLYVNSKLFKSIGVNRYNLLAYNSEVHCANSFDEKDIDKMFSELNSLGITTLRFWLFQSFTNSGEDLDRFDYVIEKAKEYQIKLIPVLENHWADCTAGGVKEDWWYESGYNNPYDNYSLSLIDYLEKIVPLYQDESTILTWQIINEAENNNEKVLYGFAKDTSEFIKKLDKNHLVSFGTTGTKQSTDLYRKIHALKSIDVLEYHDYGEPEIEMPKELYSRFADAKYLHKPLLVGESGINKAESNYIKLLNEKINAFFDKGGSVYILWSYGDNLVTDDGHNFNIDDPVASIIKSISKEISK